MFNSQNLGGAKRTKRANTQESLECLLDLIVFTSVRTPVYGRGGMVCASHFIDTVKNGRLLVLFLLKLLMLNKRYRVGQIWKSKVQKEH